MENISNVKIEKLRAALAKTQAELAKLKARTAACQTKHREQTKELETLIAFEVAARYRDLIGNEALAAQIKQNKAALAHFADATEQEAWTMEN